MTGPGRRAPVAHSWMIQSKLARAMRGAMRARRGHHVIAALVGIALAAAAGGAAGADRMSLQEILLRAKPATVLVVSEVSSEVTLDCGSGPRAVTPNPFR